MIHKTARAANAPIDKVLEKIRRMTMSHLDMTNSDSTTIELTGRSLGFLD